MKAEILTRATAELEKSIEEELNNEDRNLEEVKNETTTEYHSGELPVSDGKSYGDCER